MTPGHHRIRTHGHSALGLLIDSTVFVTAGRRQQTPQDVVARLLNDYSDVESTLSLMSAGELVHGCHFERIPELTVRRIRVTVQSPMSSSRP